MGRKRYRDTSLNGIRRPDSDESFAAYTERLIGMRLSVSKLSIYGSGGSYEIAEPFDDTRAAMRKAWLRRNPRFTVGNADMDMNRLVMKGAFGELSCGGIAGHAYGQARVSGHRHRRRLERWVARRSKASRA